MIMAWSWEGAAPEFQWASPVTVYLKKVGIGGESSSFTFTLEPSDGGGSQSFTDETYLTFLGALHDFFEAQGFVGVSISQETPASRDLIEE